MRASLKLALPVLASVGSAAAAPQVDMAEVMKWSNTKVVRYHVEGVYEAWTPIADEASQSNVTDGLVVDVIWEMRARKAQGMPQIQNKASTSKGLRTSIRPAPRL